MKLTVEVDIEGEGRFPVAERERILHELVVSVVNRVLTPEVCQVYGFGDFTVSRVMTPKKPKTPYPPPRPKRRKKPGSRSKSLSKKPKPKPWDYG